MRAKFYKQMALSLVVVLITILGNYLSNGGINDISIRVLGGINSSSRNLGNTVLTYFRGFGDIQRLVDQNAELKQENYELMSLSSDYFKLEEENRQLRSQLDLPRRFAGKLLEVDILDVQRSPIVSTIVINAGSAQGVKESATVIANGNILVGQVNEVNNNSSRVILLDDPRSNISVKTTNSGILANAVGILDKKISLDLIAVQDDVFNGETVRTSGLDTLAEFLTIGDISEVSSRDGSLFKTVIVESLLYPLHDKKMFVII
jgi:rod shape-determining protein MreC